MNQSFKQIQVKSAVDLVFDVDSESGTVIRVNVASIPQDVMDEVASKFSQGAGTDVDCVAMRGDVIMPVVAAQSCHTGQ